ncbi:MAG: hypothetical protein K2H96_02760 [Muribaculaceae bacterium]|nr:hypothetical protein [Muribaculaceae bacterium]
MKRLIFIAVILGFMCGACSKRSKMDAKFEEIDTLCDTNPRLAMSMLDSIDYGSLSVSDRHRYDLLDIKSRDKAYVRHTSDSIVLDVIDYYQSHKKTGLYPEALYYGGRVYSDIGDLPTALTYFQKAIDLIPDDKDNLRFKSIVYNQTGRLLHSLRLDSSAVKYLEKSLMIEQRFTNNEFALSFTHKLLGNSYRNIKDVTKSHHNIDLAVKYSSNLPSAHRANILMYLAGILDTEGKSDSALSVIRPLPYLVDSLTMSECLVLASELYRDAGILDTAYMYARKLTQLNDPGNKRTGYKVIFSDKLREYVPKDTLIALVSEYKNTIEEYIDRYEGENAIIQNTRYNYVVHDRERINAEKKLYVYTIIAFIAVIITLILLAIILYSKYRKADTKADIVTAINIMKELPEISNEETEIMDNKYSGAVDQTETPSIDNGVAQEYPEKLEDIKNRIMAGIKTSDDKDISSLVNPTILSSQIYRILKEKIESRNSITNSEEVTVYKSLEELIESVSSGFSYRLRILTEDRITASEQRMAMLMKCGFSPLQISILFGREKSTISTHRRNLSFKITGQKKADKSLDLIIISL